VAVYEEVARINNNAVGVVDLRRKLNRTSL